MQLGSLARAKRETWIIYEEDKNMFKTRPGCDPQYKEIYRKLELKKNSLRTWRNSMPF
jgi:hypothetical protein